MSPRLLIINCSSPYFFYIPMGTFGLCDYLDQREIATRIFNPSLYPEQEVSSRLLVELAAFAPTHVGFVLHWQETAHGLITALELVKAWNPKTVTLCGGFTASYFAEDLLRAQLALDYVIVGDPEEPVAHLLQGRPVASIANLVRRDQDGTVQRNPNHWLITPSLLDELSFSRLDFLIDADRYVEKINTKLGFPIFVGRGCIFDCEYCGGSRQAFRSHSHRHKPAVRSIAAILEDLRSLKGWTRLLYICYENDPAFIVALFREISEDHELRGYFTLHYGAWHLLDAQFLESYRRAFDIAATPPLFEFSPEVYADGTRAAIKGGATYTLEQLRKNIGEIWRTFNGRVRIEVFFSRYHPSLTAEMLAEEMRNIYRFKHRIFLEQGASVHICFDHLSTDVGSRNWEQHVDDPGFFGTLLRLKQGVDAGLLYPFPVDNLCLFIPEHLDQAFRIRFEAQLLVLEHMERYCHELFHILFSGLDDLWLEELDELLVPFLAADSLSAFFIDPPLDVLLDGLGRRLTANLSLSASLPFLGDLVRFSREKIAHLSRCQACGEPIPLHGCFVINPKRISLHQHDYPDLIPFIERLQAGKDDPPAYQRTVCMFLDSGIVTVPHGYYRATFRYFEQPQTLADYQASLCGKQGLDWDTHDQLLKQLIAEGVLVQSSLTPITFFFELGVKVNEL